MKAANSDIFLTRHTPYALSCSIISFVLASIAIELDSKQPKNQITNRPQSQQINGLLHILSLDTVQLHTISCLQQQQQSMSHAYTSPHHLLFAIFVVVAIFKFHLIKLELKIYYYNSKHCANIFSIAFEI